jgi:hypothetical protein
MRRNAGVESDAGDLAGARELGICRVGVII